MSRTPTPTAPSPEAPAPARGGRRASLVVGLGLVLAGLGVLGWYGWEMYGTTYVAERRHGSVVEQLEREWDARAGGDTGRDTGDGAGGEAAAGGTPVEAAGGALADAVIRIPRFGDDYAVPVLEGVGDDVLATGYGHFTDSADPGGRGNYAVAAHRVTHGEPLRDMPELQPGDDVVVETADTVYTYRLTSGGDDLVVGFEDYWVVDRLPTNPAGGVQPVQEPGQRLITLTTCASVFETDERMIAFGELVDASPRRTTG